ncbi:16S rRNA (uracil(1498)-N(3))-methyltransferase [Synechococcales cyanobacterium C]|uniref:Ribosomal RNA small subunit methyltransferase E n=1 Tax=Petrachloros mirabilis ULC683 TaxID=2781853 RepID=A0A8K2A8S8_9CYAN|nr:16S rRNA (uracil(1498)-N(3))-methyltransferase [Petrachloros mirabilis ULC683]
MSHLSHLAVAPAQIQGEQVMLKPEQQHYLHHVLRLQSGDQFRVFDGQGRGWLAELHGSDATAQLLLSLTLPTELSAQVTLVAAVPKGNGFDEVVRCSTELGVAGIVPLLSDRTLVQPSAHKLKRWQRIATEATEQSHRQRVPEVLPPQSLPEALASRPPESQSYFCVVGEAPSLLDCLLEHRNMAAITVFTGPEGGWTEAEQAGAIAAQCQPVSLGKRVLRAVTAPLSALAVISLYQDSLFRINQSTL